MGYRLGAEVLGVSSLLTAALFSTAAYYFNAMGLASSLPLISGLTMAYTVSTLIRAGSRPGAYGLLLYLSGLVLTPLSVAYESYVAVAPAALILVSTALLSRGVQGKPTTPVFSLAVLPATETPIPPLLVYSALAIASLDVIDYKVRTHRVLLPLGFLAAAALTALGLPASGAALALALVSAIALYHNGGYEACPFRVEPRLAALGLSLVTTSLPLTLLTEGLGALWLEDTTLLVLTVGLYMLYAGLIAPRG